MTPQQLQDVYSALAASVPAEAQRQAAAIDAAAVAKGKSLGGTVMTPGGNLAGTYNYNRLVSPVVGQLVSGLELTGKQYALKQAISDSLNAASNNYNNAMNSYSARVAASNATPQAPYDITQGGANTIEVVDTTGGNRAEVIKDANGNIISYGGTSTNPNIPDMMTQQGYEQQLKQTDPVRYNQMLANNTVYNLLNGTLK